jgi:hypothetical protein
LKAPLALSSVTDGTALTLWNTSFFNEVQDKQDKQDKPECAGYFCSVPKYQKKPTIKPLLQ